MGRGTEDYTKENMSSMPILNSETAPRLPAHTTRPYAPVFAR